MARFSAELPNEILREIDKRDRDTPKMMEQMVVAGGETVLANVRSNIGRSFETTRSLLQGLKLTRAYKTPSDGGINTKVGFYGYSRTHKSKKYPQGIPIPLIAAAREYGTSSGESPKPFFRRSFKKGEIDGAMQKIHDRYIKD